MHGGVLLLAGLSGGGPAYLGGPSQRSGRPGARAGRVTRMLPRDEPEPDRGDARDEMRGPDWFVTITTRFRRTSACADAPWPPS